MSEEQKPSTSREISSAPRAPAGGLESPPWTGVGGFSLWVGDCREVMAELPPVSVDCCVTSPPYWNLRRYDVPAGDSQLGLERTPQEFVEALVAVFAGVHRVLAPYGTCWIVIGDSYASNSPGGTAGSTLGKQGAQPSSSRGVSKSKGTGGLKPKDLALIPHRLVVALQDWGWWVRSDCIWEKPNGMPSSVVDRPTLAHEHVLMLAKQERYLFDQEMVREPGSGRVSSGNLERKENHRPGAAFGTSIPWTGVSGRNIRSVWSIPTQPFSAAWLGFDDDDHYAVMPEEVAERCVQAGSPAQVCVECGEPRYRIVNRRTVERHELDRDHPEYRPRRYDKGKVAQGGPGFGQRFTEVETMGWTECSCGAGFRPGRVLDPFMGAGTTAVAALRHGREVWGIEAGERYAAIARARAAVWWERPTATYQEVNEGQLEIDIFSSKPGD
jgi:DNA modification methylase